MSVRVRIDEAICDSLMSDRSGWSNPSSVVLFRKVSSGSGVSWMLRRTDPTSTWVPMNFDEGRGLWFRFSFLDC